MLSAISGAGYSPYLYGIQKNAQGNLSANTQWALQKAPETGSAVQPVPPVKTVSPKADALYNATYRPEAALLRQGADPAEMAVRMRMQQAPVEGQTANTANFPKLPAWSGEDPTELAVRMRIQYPGNEEQPLSQLGESAGESAGAEAVQEAFEEGQCQTCEERKYQDGSDDMGVSFQTPTRVAPELAASAVRGHEMEHVVREQAKAQREDREVVSQKVTLHTSICPECGKAYVSGGVTETTTMAKSQPEPQPQQPAAFSAVA